MQKVTDIIEAGARTSEFDISELSALASVLMYCLAVVLDPAVCADADAPLTEERVRALVGFVGRALR